MDSSLLASIQKGKKLKRAVTNDRSAPSVTGGVVGEAKSSGGGRSAGGPAASAAASSSAAPRLAGPLFAGGMPKLRSVSGAKKTEEEPVRRAPAAPAPPPPPMLPKVAPAMNRAPPPPPAAAIPKRTSVASRAAPPPPAPSASEVRKPSLQSLSSGIKSMSINSRAEEPAVNGNVPFSVANLRKTFGGPSAAKAAPSAAPAPPPTWKQPQAAPAARPPVVNRPPPPPAPAAPKASAGTPVQSMAKQTGRSTDSVTGIKSANGRWKFPGDDELPAPREFENTQKLYPSGNPTGCTVEPSPIKVAAPPPPPPAPSMMAGGMAASTRSPLRQNPVVASKMAPPKPAAASKGDPISLIEQKIQSLSAALSDAVAQEEFELCAELRNRIRKGRALKEDIEAGFDISEKEIQAI